MKKTLHRLAGLLVALFCMSAAWADGEIYYGVYQGTGTLSKIGTSKAETYDVAIHLTDPTLVGKEIRGIRIPVNTGATNATDYKGWLSKALTLSSGKMMPDIVSVEATPSGSWAEARLSEPYVIEEGGLYVGYTFTVSSVDASNTSDGNRQPVMTTATETADGLLIHTSRTYRKWVGLADNGSSAVLAILGGDGVKANAAMLEAPENLYTIVGKSISTTLTLVNHGTENIKNIEYEIVANGNTVTRTLTKSLAGKYYGRSATFTATIPAVSEKGTYQTAFRVTKVNGVENEDPLATTIQPVTYVDELPLHKPLVEEYTGTWCQYCPRALAGMEKMAANNGDNFVGVAYHDGDVMDFSSYYPAEPSGLPAVYIDRIASFDPLNGQSDWEVRKAIVAPAAITVTGEWADEGKTKIKATSTTTFIRDFTNSSFRVGYILIANDMHSTEWAQQNAYSGSSSSDPYLDKICKMSNPIRDFHYNEVALAQSAPKGAGLDESLPDDVKESVPYEHTFTFDISENTLPFDKEKLEVIAVLINTKTGEAMNCNKAHVTEADGIEEIQNSKFNNQNEAGTIYDLSGRQVSMPSVASVRTVLPKGVYIEDGKKVIK